VIFLKYAQKIKARPMNQGSIKKKSHPKSNDASLVILEKIVRALQRVKAILF
jgi:hypothetical protein